MIKAFPKTQFADIAAFQNYVIGDRVFMTHPKWSSERQCYGKTELDPVPGLGKAFRASNAWRRYIYTCEYVLAETKKAFLRIDYTSIPATYDVNMPKFQEFLRGVEILR